MQERGNEVSLSTQVRSLRRPNAQFRLELSGNARELATVPQLAAYSIKTYLKAVLDSIHINEKCLKKLSESDLWNVGSLTLKFGFVENSRYYPKSM